MDTTMITTALELPGYKIVRNLGIVRGIVVRSRSVFGTIGASLQTSSAETSRSTPTSAKRPAKTPSPA